MQIETLSPTQDLLPVAKLYAQIFAGFPWNEVSRCPQCGNFNPNLPGNICSCGQGVLQPAYPEAETVAYILEEISRPLAIGLLAIDSNPAGFAWGFPTTGYEFAMDKYRTPTGQSTILQTISSQTNYWYISEVGVNPVNRGQGLGIALTQKLAQLNPGLPLLMRTNQDSPMLKIARNQLAMQPVIASWLPTSDPENPNRVILTAPMVDSK